MQAELEAVRQAKANLDAIDAEIERGIRASVAEGHTYATVAEVVGVSRQRIHQIIRGTPNTIAGLPRDEYGRLHYQVVKQRGKPSLCEDCGTTEASLYDWANMTGDYADPDDYRRLCRPCHRRHDAARIRRGGSASTRSAA